MVPCECDLYKDKNQKHTLMRIARESQEAERIVNRPNSLVGSWSMHSYYVAFYATNGCAFETELLEKNGEAQFGVTFQDYGENTRFSAPPRLKNKCCNGFVLTW
jgi:hypothetical protein